MAIDFSKVKKIIGPGGKEVKKIVRTSDGVVLWQNNAIKKVEFTNPDIEYGSMWFGDEYNAYIGVSFSKYSNEGTLSKKIYDTFKTASSEGYKYYRFYYKNAHEMFMETKSNSYYNLEATMYTAKIRTFNDMGTSLAYQNGYNEIYHKWEDGKIYGYLICGNSTSGLNLQHWTASAGEKTKWGEFIGTHLDNNGYFDLIGRTTTASVVESWDDGVKIATNMENYISQYFKDKNNDFVVEFSKTGTET